MKRILAIARVATIVLAGTIVMPSCTPSLEEQAGQKLREQGIHPANYKDEIVKATLSDNPEMVLLLLQAGCPLRVEYEQSISLLHLAAEYDSPQVAACLVNMGLPIDKPDNRGLTPMQLALNNEFSACAESMAAMHLRKLGITHDDYAAYFPQFCLCGDFEKAELILITGYNINTPGMDGKTALHHTAEAGYTEGSDFLLRHGADHLAKDEAGHTPLELARQANTTVCTGLIAAHTLHAEGVQQQQYDTALCQAVQTGNITRLRLLKEAGANLNRTEENGENLMHLAVRHSSAPSLEYLHEQGVSTEVRNNEQLTPLLLSVILNKPENIDTLHRIGADASATLLNGSNAMQLALLKGAYRCLKPLAAAGADYNATDSKGNTLLHFAAAHGQRLCLQHLLEIGVDVHPRNHLGWTALHYAVARNHPECATMLIQHGAVDDVTTAVLAGDPESLKKYLAEGAKLSSKDEKGSTPLHWAARLGHADICRMLVDSGADATATDTEDRTPGDRAFAAGKQDCAKTLAKHALSKLQIEHKHYTKKLQSAICNGDTATLRLLLDAGVELSGISQDGWPILHLAIRHGKTDCLRYLLARGADTATVCASSLSALHMAVSMGKTDCTRLLVAGGANANQRTSRDNAPLHIAARLGNHDCLKVLLENGADVHARNERGDTPLLEVARWSWGNAESLKALLAAGAEVNAVNYLGETALHAAAISGNVECLRELLTAGADPKATTRAGRTPLKLAESYNHYTCAKLIREAVQHAESVTNN
ncbi:MAG: ankyrin repeat domain-containing protein [Akkermansia sp.]|nr:ankyrin repeat domain-containing protein [Akkermansia sp.]